MSALADFVADGVGISRVQGLIGGSNSASPTNKIDLTAMSVTLRNPVNGKIITKHQPATLTADLSLAGPAAGGRDQITAFPSGGFYHVFYIYSSTSKTLALIWSMSSIAPTLPDGYDHYCYATTIRSSGVNTMTASLIAGAKTWYAVSSDLVRILNNGGATATTAISCAAYVPANAIRALMRCELQATSASVITIVLQISVLGFSFAALTLSISVAGTSARITNSFETPLDSMQRLNYSISGGATSGATLDILGYVVPNGDC